MSRLRGYTYTDVITIYSISRAGFIPQMFGFDLPNTHIVFELLSKYDGKAIIHDPAKAAILDESKAALPCLVAVDYLSVSDADVTDLELPDLPEAKAEDFAFIYHSSGSVSGMPKVVPKTNKWLSTIENKSGAAFCIGHHRTQDVYVWTYVGQFIQSSLFFISMSFGVYSESFSHAMASCRMSTQSAPITRPRLTRPAVLQLILHRAACLVQPTRIDFDSRELASMIREANVNRIIQFTCVLRVHLEDARAGIPEPDLLPLLRAMRQVTYAGMPLATELEDWAVSEGIPLTVSWAHQTWRVDADGNSESFRMHRMRFVPRFFLVVTREPKCLF